MSQDYLLQEIDTWETLAGVPVPLDTWGHYLNWREVSEDRTQARDLTNPYGTLYFAVGNAEGDEQCEGDFATFFDSAELPDGRIVLHSVVHTDSGGHIGDGEYNVVTREQAPHVAREMVDEALDAVGFNNVRHDEEGWGQSPCYFARCVAAYVAGGDSPPRHLPG